MIKSMPKWVAGHHNEQEQYEFCMCIIRRNEQSVLSVHCQILEYMDVVFTAIHGFWPALTINTSVLSLCQDL